MVALSSWLGRQAEEGRIERCDESGSAGGARARVEVGVKEGEKRGDTRGLRAARRGRWIACRRAARPAWGLCRKEFEREIGRERAIGKAAGRNTSL